MFSIFLRGSPKAVFFRAFVMIALIALADWRVDANIPLGFLYLLPMLLVGNVTGERWHIAAVAILCTVLAEIFDSFDWVPNSGIPRDILVFAAFFCIGLFAFEVVRNRQLAQQHLNQIEAEVQARRDAEEQLKVLVESSPAAIFTANLEGRVLLANDAVHRMLGLPAGALQGRLVRDYLPALLTVPAPDLNRQAFRTVMQCRGRRENGEAFLADIWFSTYRTSAGSRLAAMVVDASEDLRSREESSLHQLLAGSKILVGAVSHEIRNVCGAIAIVHQNLARGGVLAKNADFEALGTLILALEKIAALDLRQTANQAASTDLDSLMDELRIVVEPSLRELEIDVRWDLDRGLPHVWADRQSLMQVFLNVVKNGERAMLKQAVRQLTIAVRVEGEQVFIRFRDTGSGVAHPDRLFRPFQQGAQATGLGLYLSRAFMRSFRGDLRYEPEPHGSSFVVELSTAASEEKEGYGPRHSDSAAGRSQSVSGGVEPAVGDRA